MEKLYEYVGTVTTFCHERNIKGESVLSYIELEELYNDEKAPIRITAPGAVGRYLEDLNSTDEEERYITCKYFYNRLLQLRRIEVPGDDFSPAKVITSDDPWSEECKIFGEKEYIKTSEPKSMGPAENSAWLAYKFR